MSLASAFAGSLQGTYGGGSNISSNSARNWTAGAEASMANAKSALQRMEFQDKSWEKTMKFNAAEAQLNRDWQEYMSGTAYQRAIADMQKAGLNPILAYAQGGASVGTGAQATMSPMSGAQFNAVADSYGESSGMSSGSNWYDNNLHGVANSLYGTLANAIGGVLGSGVTESLIKGDPLMIESTAKGVKQFFQKAQATKRDLGKALEHSVGSHTRGSMASHGKYINGW